MASRLLSCAPLFFFSSSRPKGPPNAERTRGNCIAVDIAAAAGRKCRDLLAESPDKGNAKNQTTPHVQI
jgi:hypothetical protein